MLREYTHLYICYLYITYVKYFILTYYNIIISEYTLVSPSFSPILVNCKYLPVNPCCNIPYANHISRIIISKRTISFEWLYNENRLRYALENRRVHISLLMVEEK